MGELEIILSCKYSEYRATVKVPEEYLKNIDMYELGSFVKDYLVYIAELEEVEDEE